MADFLNSPFGLLLVGFLLTTGVGTYFQVSASKRQAKRQLQIERYAEGTKFLNDLSELAGTRFFGLQRWLWAIKNPSSNDIGDERNSYFECVRLWNQRTWANRATLRLLVGEAQAELFLDYGDDERGDQPRSLHYLFHRAHQSVLDAERGLFEPDKAQVILDDLSRRWSQYFDGATSHFLRRAVSLQLLEVPDDKPGLSSVVDS